MNHNKFYKDTYSDCYRTERKCSMDNNLLYNLMMKCLVIFNIGFLLLFPLFMLGVPLQILIWFLLFVDISVIIIELIKKNNYPIYCYIYTA